jgi:adenylate kinase family enzyme
MKKIIIIGSSGSGKTTLASILSKKLNIPHTELDALYNQANWTIRHPDEFKAEVFTLVQQETWIFCGNYYSKLGKDFWLQADTIIWCDYPFHTVLSRLLQRTVVRSLKRQELWNGNRESFRKSFLSKRSIIIWMITSWRKQKTRYGQLFNNPQTFPNTTLIRLRSSRATKQFIEQAN